MQLPRGRSKAQPVVDSREDIEGEAPWLLHNDVLLGWIPADHTMVL